MRFIVHADKQLFIFSILLFLQEYHALAYSMDDLGNASFPFQPQRAYDKLPTG